MRKLMFGAAMIASALYGCAQDTERAGEAEALATFELSNGNRLSMTGLADGEIVVTETTPAGPGERFVVDEHPGASPLELFTRLTPEGTAVPAGLAASATAEERAAWMSQRQLASGDAAAPFYLDVADLGWQPIASAAPGQGSCDPSTGAAYFEEHHCGQTGPYGYGKSAEYCDNGKAFNYWQRSVADMRHTYSRTAACDGTGRIRHSRVDGGDWLTILDEPIEANTVATYYSYRKSGLKKDRRARSEPYDPYDTDAYVRQWVKFYDQVVTNAP